MDDCKTLQKIIHVCIHVDMPAHIHIGTGHMLRGACLVLPREMEVLNEKALHLAMLSVIIFNTRIFCKGL